MCGIAGLQVKQNSNFDSGLLSSFEKSLYKRGPDGHGRFVSKSTALISTRLAIMDIAHGDQPLYSPKGVALVANGEIYNAPELREKFPDYPFKTLSDCEPILALYERYGLEFIEHLRGMYAIALYDSELDRLVLARDPFGIKPLYCVENENGFAFASTVDALLEAGLCGREIDSHAELELMQLKYNSGEKTIIQNLHRIEPGSVSVVEGGKTVMSRGNATWPRNAAAQNKPASGFAKPSASTLLKQFDEVICDSVRVHLRSDAPWCLYYSGGIDSTILMLAAKRVASQPVRALTVGYEGNETVDESRDAQRLAAGAGVECERIEMSADDFWAKAPQIAASIDDPMADIAVLPLFMLAEATARNHDKVAITGEGADEVFGGYARYRRAILPDFLRPKRARRGVFTGGPVPAERFNAWSSDMDALERAQSSHWPNRMQLLQAIDILERLPDCLLIKLDRALMELGVEGRTPFLDKEVQAFADQVPSRFRATPWMGKMLLRDWIAKTYPQARPYMKKKGFKVPVGRWMQARSGELARLIAGQPGIARMFSAHEVSAICTQAGRTEQPAWSLLFYALWHSHHILGMDSTGDIASVLTASAKC